MKKDTTPKTLPKLNKLPSLGFSRFGSQSSQLGGSIQQKGAGNQSASVKPRFVTQHKGGS